MARSTSLVARVAQGSALVASAAALLAAVATTALASYLLQRAEDRRLAEAAVTFALELDEDGVDLDAIRAVHRDESAEMDHSGMHFAVYDRQGRLLVGDPRVRLPVASGCADANTLRVCRAQSTRGVAAVAGDARSTHLPIFAGAAVISALLAAALAWLASRPISRFAVAPLTRLRERIAELDVDAISDTRLGPADGVLEVDALRSTIRELVARVDRALGLAQRFAANAAHELRTPLTFIRGELELLSESIEEPTATANASRAEQQLAELSLLVERLLILSVPARSRADAHELVSLRDLLEDSIGALPMDDRQRVAVSDQDALIRGDSVLLATMIANGVANGLKFGNRVSTSLVVSGGEAVIHIDDDGPGLAHAERERAFEPFFRSQDALRSRVPGHGLGLALIRHIAQAHGGGASFADKAERGARLEIRIPGAEAVR